MDKIYKLRTYLAIYLISTATLTYEIGLTRLFSLSQGYHFAFMVLSIALLGIGAGGSIIFFWKGSQKLNLSSLLSILASLFALLTLLSFILANHILFDPVKAAWDKGEFIKIFYQYLLLSLPFIMTGMILSAAMRAVSDKVHGIYFSDMAGAGTGCLLILLVLSYRGGETAVIVSSLLAIGAAFLFREKAGSKSLLPPVAALLILLTVTLAPGRLLELKLSPYRELSSILNFPGAKLTGRIFSPAGEIHIVESPAVRAAPGMSLNVTSPLPEQVGFTVNGGALTTVTDAAGDLSFLSHLPSSLPYRINGNAHVFIIGAGGGMELLAARQNGAATVRGSESNSAVIEAMTGPLAAFSKNLYGEMKIDHRWGRDILRESDMKFDIIEFPLTGTLGSSSSGIMGLHEDYRITTQAVRDYMEGLSEGGLLAFSLYLLPPPRQELKLLSTIVSALEEEGIDNIGGSIAAIRSWGVMTIVIKKEGFLRGDIQIVKAFCREEGFDLVWYDGIEEREANIYNRFPVPLYYRLFSQLFHKESRDSLYSRYLFNITPATDDRPFFGQTFKLTRMKETYESVGKKWGILMEGGYLLPWVLIQSIIASLLLIMTPLLFFKGTRRPSSRLVLVTVYFAAIGMAFMFVEIALIQRVIPILGESVYAISAALFSILISTGVGSYLSGRVEWNRKNPVNMILIIPVLILCYLFFLPVTTGMISALPLALKYALTFFILSPLGLFMGIPFPTGMQLLGKADEGLIPWAWCINGSFSVISSVLAMIIAMNHGFVALQALAALFYVMAWAALKRMAP